MVARVLALVAVLLFLVLLIQREMLSSRITTQNQAMLRRGINIGLLPFGLAFLMILGERVITLTTN